MGFAHQQKRSSGDVSGLEDAELDSAHIGVWKVRVCTSEEQYRFREVPELALRSVPRSIALSLEVPVETNDVE